MKKIIAVFFTASLFLMACKASKASTQESVKEETRVEKWVIANATVKCGDNNLSDCYQVKKLGSAAYENMSIEIEGFNYEPGYKYQIELQVVPSKKAPTKYVLIQEVFKIASK